MYRVRLLESAVRDLARLEKATAARILGRISWLADNIESAGGKRLTGDLAGFYRLRHGDYRVIYQVLRKEETLVVHAVGHRRDIYRK